VVEVADDLVRSCVGGNEGPSFREIEVELIEGDEHLLSDVVRRLRKAGIGPPDPASKLERVLGGRPKCELEPVKLKRRASVAELVSAAFSNSTRHLILNDRVSASVTTQKRCMTLGSAAAGYART